MRARTSINYQQLYTELDKATQIHGEPTPPTSFLAFLRSWKFWLEAAKIIFKLFFKLP